MLTFFELKVYQVQNYLSIPFRLSFPINFMLQQFHISILQIFSTILTQKKSIFKEIFMVGVISLLAKFLRKLSTILIQKDIFSVILIFVFNIWYQLPENLQKPHFVLSKQNQQIAKHQSQNYFSEQQPKFPHYYVNRKQQQKMTHLDIYCQFINNQLLQINKLLKFGSYYDFFYIIIIQTKMQKSESITQIKSQIKSQTKTNKLPQSLETTNTNYKSQRSFNTLQEEQINSNLKNTQYYFSYKVDDEEILDLFQQNAKKMGFQMIERQETYAMTIKQNKNKMMEFFACLPFMNKSASTAIKLSLTKGIHSGSKQTKICRVKGLVGSVLEIKQFLSSFKQKINNYEFQTNYFIFEQAKQEISDKNEYSDPYNIQTSSFYTIQKMLNQDESQIGKHAKQMVNDYISSFKNVEESVTLLPLPMNDATKIVNELMYIFNETINKPPSLKKKKASQQSDKNSKLIKTGLEPAASLFLHPSIFPYTRISIEKYIFIKLEETLYSIYMFKNIETNKKFQAKRDKIFKKYTLMQIFDETSLTQKYWSVQKEGKQFMNNFLSREDARKVVKFSKVCQQLQKISITSNPRQKIKYTQIMYTSLKTFFYDFSKRKYQLSSMEDIIPVLIMVVLLCNIPNMRSEFDIMNDFVLTDPYEMQSQKRLLINLSESYNFVIRDWRI